jgi:Glyoxalase/Bleomycin resistance protein/Dioxygenase superfamily
MILPGTSIVQIAWVVNDLEAAVARFSKTMKAGPFSVFRHIKLTDPLHRGKPVRSDFSMAVTQAGDVQIELIEQHDNMPSVYRDLYPQGAEGFHHVAVLVPDVAQEAARYQALGFEIGCSGRFGVSEFVYIDTSSAIGHMVEILPDNDAMRGFFASVRKASQDWDGQSLILG